MRPKGPRERMIPVNISFRPDLLERVDREAIHRNIGRSALVREALSFWLTQEAQILRDQQPTLLQQE